MGLTENLAADVDRILAQEWSVRDGYVVPETQDVALAGGAVRLSATMLYADLADSTHLVMNYDRRVAAKVFKSFLTCCSRLILERAGAIRSFDGDRVLGVFLGDSKNTSAAQCALNINFAFREIIKPKLEAKYANLKSGSYTLAHCVGVDTSEVLVVRGGVRDNNDLVWVGRASNVAAKLSTVRESPYHSLITKDVYDVMDKSAKYGPKDQNMWEERAWKAVPGVETIYRSNWQWSP